MSTAEALPSSSLSHPLLRSAGAVLAGLPRGRGPHGRASRCADEHRPVRAGLTDSVDLAG